MHLFINLFVPNAPFLKALNFFQCVRTAVESDWATNILVVEVPARLSPPWLVPIKITQFGILVFLRSPGSKFLGQLESKYDEYCIFLCELLFFCIKVPTLTL